MQNRFSFLKWASTLGSGTQNFLGAGWVRRVLEWTPQNKKRLRALQLLSLSPHYFINESDPAYAGMSREKYLEAAFDGCISSRQRIVEELLADRIGPDDVVLDYGCGPGFLAKSLAPYVKTVYALDISPGTIACAKVLNDAENITYLTPDAISAIPDEGVDVVVSFALIQHLSIDIYRSVLDVCRQKLKPGGRLVLHVQLLSPEWRTEEQWRNDHSITGRVKLKYGLHCFALPAETHSMLLRESGFENVKIQSIAELTTDHFDDICRQHLVTATKPA